MGKKVFHIKKDTKLRNQEKKFEKEKNNQNWAPMEYYCPFIIGQNSLCFMLGLKWIPLTPTLFLKN